MVAMMYNALSFQSNSFSSLRPEAERIAIFAGVLFLAYSLPHAGQWEQLETTPLEDSHSDVSLGVIVEKFRDRLPEEHKKDAPRLGSALLRISGKYKMSPGLLLSLIETESSFRYGVVSKAGAVGLMQVRPATAGEVARRYRISGYRSAADLTNPVLNLELGVAYLAYLRTRFGSSVHYLAAYNLGPTALRSRMNQGNYELGVTKEYVKKIQRRTLAIRGERGSTVGRSSAFGRSSAVGRVDVAKRTDLAKRALVAMP